MSVRDCFNGLFCRKRFEDAELYHICSCVADLDPSTDLSDRWLEVLFGIRHGRCSWNPAQTDCCEWTQSPFSSFSWTELFAKELGSTIC